jgi:hypothetical protein
MSAPGWRAAEARDRVCVEARQADRHGDYSPLMDWFNCVLQIYKVQNILSPRCMQRSWQYSNTVLFFLVRVGQVFLIGTYIQYSKRAYISKRR